MVIVAGLIALVFVLFMVHKLLKKPDAKEEMFNEVWRTAVARGRGGGDPPVLNRPAESDEEDDVAVNDDRDDLVPRGRLAKMRAAKEKKKEERRNQQAAREQNNTQQRANLERRNRERGERERLQEIREEERLAVLEEKKQQRTIDEQQQWECGMELEGDGEADLDESPLADPEEAQRFIDKIKAEKVAFLEPLSAEFGISVEYCVSAIEGFQKAGRLPGVFDDRGKFIHITPAEYAAVEAYVAKKGRVAISDLAAESASLIASAS
eukprot:TRINITY_DN11740_c0_g1_i1.p1 TRINITY_DN11740_c0_g1~~TRINITY_DN11740_c0_g1_i1.p1  ORF type:complete len:285 (+),score=95.44 TRINITY_DN11740_c0_g1_i1:59-856(+)